MKSIVLLSGGLDSVVNFKKAYDDTEIVLCLTFDYGQKSAKREIDSAKNICERYKVLHQIIDLLWLKNITNTALVNDEKAVPFLTIDDLNSNSKTIETAKAVWVPNRNGVFLNIAGSYADAMESDYIVTGFNSEEAQTFLDNSPAYVRITNSAFELSTLNHPIVISYTQDLNKHEIVNLGIEIKAPLELIWSCYLGGDKMCGMCESCLRCIRAFKKGGNFEIIKDRFDSNKLTR